MLRSTFFAGGLFVALWGITFLFVDQIVLKSSGQVAATETRTNNFRGMFAAKAPTIRAGEPKTIRPADWAAFSLMSIGSVTMLYAAALPKRRDE